MKQISGAFIGVALMLIAPASDATTIVGGRTYYRLQELQLVVLKHAAKAGRLPTTDEGLASVREPDGRLYEPWFFVDEWGERFIYRAPSSSKERLFDLYSKGPNRRDDNGEEDDFVSWDYR